MNSFAIQSATTTPATGGAQTSSGTTGSGASDVTNPLTDKQTFITLLVAQLKNQDPLNPVDGVQFLSQLTEISSVEQLVDIRQDTDILANNAASAASNGSNNSSGSGSH